MSRKNAEFGELSLKEGLKSEEMAEYERMKGELKEQIDFLVKDIEQLKAKRKKTSKHIPLGDLPKEDRFEQLSPIIAHLKLVDTYLLTNFYYFITHISWYYASVGL